MHDPETLTKERRAAIKAQVEKGWGPGLEDCGTAEAVLCRHIFAAYERLDTIEADATTGDVEEARTAWAVANAECCELKTEVEQLREAVAAYRDERVEAREGRTFRLIVTERDDARRYLKDAIRERNDAEAANAIHMKACERMEREMTPRPSSCHVADCEGDAMVWLGCCYIHDRERSGNDEGDVNRAALTEAKRGRRDAILERNVAEGRIEAALEYVEKWGENCEGWAAILRGEDG